MSVLESYLVANAVSQGVAGVDLATFMGLSNNFPGGSNSSWEITAKELLQTLTGQTQGIGGGYGDYAKPGGLQMAVKKNLRDNGPRMLMSIVAIPIAFRVGKKLLKSPRRQANKLLRDTGLGVMV